MLKPVPDPNCACEICRNNKKFNVPLHLLQKLKLREVVIFAGAGVSTEKRTVFRNTLYEDVVHEIASKKRLTFPDLMSAYCKQPDGRQKLLQKIKDRLDYVSAFPELYREATRFHHQLSTLFLVDNIITTNWDDYFERECGATPYVSAADFALWQMPGRKVFKIHGSINNLGSLVLTTDDYRACYERLSKGLLGSALKGFLGTKTIVYVGYSFSDSDFIKIHKLLTTEMRGLRPHSYFISLSDRDVDHFKDTDVTTICTDGAFFIQTLKAHLIADGTLISDDAFSGLGDLLDSIRTVHDKIFRINLEEYPSAIYTLAYQDGLQHALERILAMHPSGQYSHDCYVQGQMTAYEKIRKEHVKKKNYWDAAYVEGYQNGLMLVLCPPEYRRSVPVYYVYGLDDCPSNLQDYKKVLRRSPSIHRAAYQRARGMVERKFKGTKGVSAHHTPFL